MNKIDKRWILAALVFAIVAVILRDFWDIYHCTNSGSNSVWNPSTKICETVLKPSGK